MSEAISAAPSYRKTSIRERWLYRTPIGHHLNRAVSRAGLALIHFAARKSPLLEYAKNEWTIAFPEADEMQAEIGRSVFDVVAAFSLEGQSGFSANYTVNYIKKALRFEPFSPLQGTDDEWNDVSDYGAPGDSPLWQNKRLSSVFREGGPDGIWRFYDINGKIFEEPDGARYTSSDSRIFITFPYVQGEPEIVKVDENGEPIPDVIVPKLRARAKKLRAGTNDQITPGVLDEAAGLLENSELGTLKDFSKLYYELLYAVESIWPGETRHQTALRYIRERENQNVNDGEDPAGKIS
jgi:hypothetical protein